LRGLPGPERTDREERTGAVAGLSPSPSGWGPIIGPAVAPVFVLPLVGLAGPMFAFVVMVYAAANGVRTLAGAAPATEDETARSSLERNQDGLSV
jgi:hypothetical protein